MGTPDQIAKAEHLINEVLAEELLGHLLLHLYVVLNVLQCFSPTKVWNIMSVGIYMLFNTSSDILDMVIRKWEIITSQ